MNYFWEVALIADDCGVPRESLRLRPAKSYSPYIEASFVDLNQTSVQNEGTIEGNPLLRFTPVFSRILDINTLGLEKTRELFFDVVMQYMIQLDLRQGLCHEEYYLRFILQDFMQGACGVKYMDVLDQFDHVQIRQLLCSCLQLFHCGYSLSIFRRAIRAAYPDSLVYSSNDAPRELLIYIGMKDTEIERKKVQFLLDVYLPINYKTYLFWEHHFGIVDVDVTMELDEMVLF